MMMAKLKVAEWQRKAKLAATKVKNWQRVYKRKEREFMRASLTAGLEQFDAAERQAAKGEAQS
jgi:hypothetical protein